MRKDSQDVGSEAAIIERVRNSSLVECTGTDNVARLKHPTEALDPAMCQHTRTHVRKQAARDGRGALCEQRSLSGSTGGAHTRANAGMSSVIEVRTLDTEGLRVPGQRQSSQG